MLVQRVSLPGNPHTHTDKLRTIAYYALIDIDDSLLRSPVGWFQTEYLHDGINDGASILAPMSVVG